MKAHCPTCEQEYGSESEAKFQTDKALRLQQRIDALRNALSDIESDNCGACDTAKMATTALERDDKLAVLGG